MPDQDSPIEKLLRELYHEFVANGITPDSKTMGKMREILKKSGMFREASADR